MGNVSIRLPDELEERLDREANLSHRKRSEMVREAVDAYVTQRERERFMAELIAEAKTAYGNEAIRQEALAIAEEALPLDNEALDRAEGRDTDKTAPATTTEKWWK